MGFLKIVLAVVLGNLITLAIVSLLAILFFGSGLNALQASMGIDLPKIDITFANEPLWSNTTSAVPAHPKAAPNSQGAPSNIIGQSPSSRVESKRDHAAINSARQMCKFWDNEYRKDRGEQSKSFRTQACGRYERLSGNSSDQIVNAAPQASSQDRTNQILAGRRAEREQEQRERQTHQQKCDRIKRRMDVIQAQLRDGYTVSEGNRLRGERRDLSYQYSTECLLGR